MAKRNDNSGVQAKGFIVKAEQHIGLDEEQMLGEMRGSEQRVVKEINNSRALVLKEFQSIIQDSSRRQAEDMRAELRELGISNKTTEHIDQNSAEVARLRSLVEDLMRQRNSLEQDLQDRQADYAALATELEELSKRYADLTEEQLAKDKAYQDELSRIRSKHDEGFSRLEEMFETHSQKMQQAVFEIKEKKSRGYSDAERAAQQVNDDLIDEIVRLKKRIKQLEEERAYAEPSPQAAEVAAVVTPDDIEIVSGDDGDNTTTKSKDEIDAEECFQRGKKFYNSKDYAEAVKWYRKAAEQGHADAQYNLGICYRNGYGVTQDNDEAVKWYRKAAEQGLASAQCNLGYCYEKGKGVPQDEKEAVKWYRKAAEQGLAEAQNNLGICYEKGIGVPQDEKEAVKWYRKAAEQGHVKAQFLLGFCYERGDGVSKDINEAIKLYRKAAEQGDAQAKAALKRLGYNT